MNNNNRQSVNNFVYRKKNKDQNNNTQSVNNFVYHKNRNNDISQTQPTSQPNNSYDFTDINTQPTNSYNDFNNNQQTYQQNSYQNNNMMDTYKDYNTPVNYLDVNSYPVEVPLPNKMKLSVIIILASFFVPFIFGFLVVALPFLQNIVTIPFGLSFFRHSVQS